MAEHSGERARRPWPLRREFQVAYHDVDVLNHLNHATYLPWMETLRCAYYLPLLGTDDPRTLDIILAEADCRYFRPAGYGERLVGEVAPARPLGRTSFTLLYRFVGTDSSAPVFARGRTAIVCFDYATKAKKPIAARIGARVVEDAVDPTEEGWPPDEPVRP